MKQLLDKFILGLALIYTLSFGFPSISEAAPEQKDTQFMELFQPSINWSIRASDLGGVRCQQSMNAYVCKYKPIPEKILSTNFQKALSSSEPYDGVHDIFWVFGEHENSALSKIRMHIKNPDVQYWVQFFKQLYGQPTDTKAEQSSYGTRQKWYWDKYKYRLILFVNSGPTNMFPFANIELINMEKQKDYY